MKKMYSIQWIELELSKEKWVYAWKGCKVESRASDIKPNAFLLLCIIHWQAVKQLDK